MRDKPPNREPPTTTRKVQLMRSALTNATYWHGMGGLPRKKGHGPKPVTLPKFNLPPAIEGN